MSQVQFNDIQSLTGGIPTVKGQRLLPTAWVNFNGTGTVAIRDSENVSSITDNGVGDYTVNFVVAMTNASYSPIGTSIGNTSSWHSVPYSGGHALNTNWCRMTTNAPNSAMVLQDIATVNCIILGGQ